MPNELWINLPVSDLTRSIAFFTGLGFRPNPGPGNGPKSASFLVGSKDVVLMLFDKDLFAAFTQNAAADTRIGSEVLFSLGAGSRGEVDEFARKALAHGGTVFGAPAESQGFMYGCGICDPDGHRWNALYMDPDKMPRA